MDNLDKFEQLSKRVWSGMACVHDCVGEACPYHNSPDCGKDYQHDIKILVQLLVDAAIHSDKGEFGYWECEE